jgi:hypothetical protein
MDQLSAIVLERTAELVREVMQPEGNPRIGHCLKVIDQYIKEPAFVDDAELKDAVIRLLDIARESHQVLIAARLASIVTRMTEIPGQDDAA